MKHFISVALVIVAIIHLLPVTGVLGVQSLTRLYGGDFSDPNLQILMRHRAVLFGIIGGVMLLGAFRVEYQILALPIGLVSVISFLILSWDVGSYNEAIRRVVLADWIALALLVLACVVKWFVGLKSQVI
jgi:hypothetical protein